jgi:murein DD-endopeptidase MepM/ murein hydrolase activator NlpD
VRPGAAEQGLEAQRGAGEIHAAPWGAGQTAARGQVLQHEEDLHFNGKPASQLHTGSDHATPVGTPVLAVADGTVVVAEDLFFEGNAVFIDHGDGLISMSFHLSEIKVQAGQEVKKGHTPGRIGSTGRATGPHLFFGVRWHDARIDPKFLLEDPDKIPAVTNDGQRN